MLTKEMQERAGRCCCHYCGGPLEIHVIMFEKYGGAGAELYCPHCQKIESGTEPEIYQRAKAFVETLDFSYYWDLPDDERTYQLNIAKVCEIISWCLKDWALLDHHGLKGPLTAALAGERHE